MLVKDVSEVDTYDRLLRYVIVGDIFVNYDLVKEGYAIASAYPPDTTCSSMFTDIQSQAEINKFGMWKPTPTPYIAPTSGNSGGGNNNCDSSYPGVCIAPPPPDLDCKDVPYKRFQVLPPDPHNFDADGDGIGCES